MPDEAEVFKTVARILAANLGCEVSAIELQHSLVEDLEIDSLDLVELAIAVETEFDLMVPEEDLKGIRTVADVVKFFHQKLEQQT